MDGNALSFMLLGITGYFTQLNNNKPIPLIRLSRANPDADAGIAWFRALPGNCSAAFIENSCYFLFRVLLPVLYSLDSQSTHFPS